jgi:hypothetical protein
MGSPSGSMMPNPATSLIHDSGRCSGRAQSPAEGFEVREDHGQAVAILPFRLVPDDPQRHCRLLGHGANARGQHSKDILPVRFPLSLTLVIRRLIARRRLHHLEV